MIKQYSQIRTSSNQAYREVRRENGEALEPNTLIIDDEVLRKGFTSTPNHVLDDTALSIPARFTYIILLSFAWQEGSCFPGQERLARKLGVSRQMVNRYLNELKARKYVRWERRGLGKTNVYHILKVRPVEADVKQGLHQDVKSIAHQDVKQGLHKEDTDEEDPEEEYSDNSKFRKVKNLKAKSNPVARKLAFLVEKLSKSDLHDPHHIRSNVTQAQKLLEASNLTLEEFILLLAGARKITLKHSANIKKQAGYMGLKNYAPYFFKVVRDLIRQNSLDKFRREFVKRKAIA